MNFNAELKKYNLTPERYEACLKDIKDKVLGNNDLDWQEVVSKYNLDTHPDVLRKASSNKPFGSVFVGEYLQNKKAIQGADEDYLGGLRREQQELRKERQKVQDERIELQRLLRESARRESFIDLVKRVFEESIEPCNFVPSPTINSDNDMIICLSDIHAGIEVDSFFNDYNMDVVEERLQKYINEIASIQQIHRCKEAHLVLGGDLISGLIHVNLRLENNENCIEQVKKVSIYIGEFVKAIMGMFERIYIHSVAGNHSRLSPKKEDNMKGEALDALIPFYLELMFVDNKTVKFSKNIIDDTIASFKTRGEHLVYAVHGDHDAKNSVVKNLTLMTGIKPDIILMGHRHNNSLATEHNVKIVCTGSLCGMDNFCIDHRISGRPEQAVIITDEFNAVKCLYDVCVG